MAHLEVVVDWQIYAVSDTFDRFGRQPKTVRRAAHWQHNIPSVRGRPQPIARKLGQIQRRSKRLRRHFVDRQNSRQRFWRPEDRLDIECAARISREISTPIHAEIQLVPPLPHFLWIDSPAGSLDYDEGTPR